MSAATKVQDNTILYKRFMVQEAIKDVGAAVTQGVLSNSAACDLLSPSDSTRLGGLSKPSPSSAAGSSGGMKALERMAYISAGDRLRKLQEGAKQVKRLFQDFTQLSDKSLSYGGEAAVAARATASKDVFVRECGLEAGEGLKPVSEAAKKLVAQGPVEVDKQLAPLQQILNNIKALRKQPRFDYEKTLREAKQKGGASSMAAQHTHLLVKRLEETISDAISSIRSHANIKPVGPQVIKDISLWPADLLRILNDALNQKPLEALTEAGREQLRRIAFDVEELQHDQQQAVTDGDMQKSEQLYFEQTMLLETMKPQFAELEGVMEKYKKEKGETFRDSLKMFQKNFRQLLTAAVRREEKDKKQTDNDADKLTDKRSLVQKARKDQKANFQLYVSEWEKLFDTNVEQQIACFRAMEELERRIHHLAAEQAILIADRVEKVNVERERALDAAAFFYFCDQRTKNTKDAAQTAQTAVETLKEVGAAIEFSITQFEQYLKECVIDHTDEELLALRQEKLNQFRQLYLTLGDLQFKKARHAEEIEKKIEYYSLQQEVAMDTLNPKAKEYSQAKKKWQSVQDEIKQQLSVLEQKSEKEAQDFKPTEQLLIKSGVNFKHPVDELNEKNAIRQQKLLEYKELMDAKVEEQHKKNGPIPIRDDDEVMLAEKARGTRTPSLSTSKSVSVLQSSEEKKKPLSASASKRKRMEKNTTEGGRVCVRGFVSVCTVPSLVGYLFELLSFLV
eukprot:gene11888-8173_t